MYVMGICDSADLLSVARLVKVVITIIKIVVPIILILSLMINYMSAVKDNDSSALAKANKVVVSKSIAALLIFFMPTFVNIIADISSYDTNSYSRCLSNANSEYISSLRIYEAKSYIGIARDSLKRMDYNIALTKVDKISDEYIKESLYNDLDAVEAEIKKKEEEEKEERQRELQAQRERLIQQLTGFSAGASGTVENALGIIYYRQCDNRWGNIKYNIKGGPNGTEATLCSSSCGYTSFAMIAAGFNSDTSINPYSVIKYFRNINDGEITYRSGGAASLSEIANNNRISKYHLKSQSIDKSQIVPSLKSGKAVIILVPGHYMVLSISSNGKVVLLDPFDNWADRRKKSGQYNSINDIEAIYGNIRTAIAYSRI